MSMGAVALAAYSRDQDAVLLATLMLALTGFAGLCWHADMVWAIPALEWMVACLSFVMWGMRRTTWLRTFALVEALRLVIHVGIGIVSVEGVALFYHLLNATFVVQLYLVSSAGGNRLGRSMLSWFRCLRPTVQAQANVGHG